MASSNVSDWDGPMPTSTSEEVEEEDPHYCSPSNRQRRQQENVDKMNSYVRRMAYQPSMPPKTRPGDESQCLTQYLNVLIKNFDRFIAHLATTMRILSQLFNPYARMQRGIFCNVLLAIALHSAAARDPNELAKSAELDLEMDNHIKPRLKCAAEKKIAYERRRHTQQSTYKCQVPQCE
ncbi:Hypothetical predicted protein [Drosophila guanche]|uniref:Uncharacterized protein n=1 Tax=Drosophila guanche TaxID=7266 RepID=A0A3B0K4U0_DROGU|nr:Hypothetical predicted protein [Drosophila guanche]